MNDHATPLETLFEKAEKYSKTTIELAKLQAIEKSADVVSGLAVQLVIFMGVILSVLILNIGLALWIGDLLGKSYYGFFAVAGGYAILAFLLYSFRDRVRTPLHNMIIVQLLKQRSHEREK